MASSSPLQNETSEVNIIPEFLISKTTFATDSGEQSFSGVVDYLLARVPPKYSRKRIICIILGKFLHGSSGFILENPITGLANQDAGTWSIAPIIIEAKKNRLTLAVPQATVAVASYCKQHKYISFFWTFRSN